MTKLQIHSFRNHKFDNLDHMIDNKTYCFSANNCHICDQLHFVVGVRIYKIIIWDIMIADS